MKRNEMKYLILILLVLCVFAVRTTPSFAQYNRVMKVLVLNSYHKGFAWSDGIMEGIGSEFKGSGQNIKLDIEYMDTKRISDQKHYQNLYELYKHKFSKRDYDLILTSDDNAFSFILKYHDELFPKKPVVFCGLNSLDKSLESDLLRLGWITGSVEMYDIRGNLDLILRLHPDVKQIIVISDKTVSSQKCKAKVQEAVHQMPASIRFNYLREDAYMEDILAQVRGLPLDSVVFLMSFFKDREGKYYSPKVGGKMISKNSPVPVYSAWDFYLGHGITGGLITSSNAQGEMGAKIALRILTGEKISDIPVLREPANYYMFDYNEMERFDIRISNLPEASMVINKPYSFYSEHKGLILTVVASISSLILIILLLFINIISRKRSEEALRESEEKYRLLLENANDAIFIIQDGLAKFHNRKTEELTGYSMEELAKIPFADFYHPEDRNMVLERRSQREKGGGPPNTYPVRIMNRSGEQLWIELSTVRIMWEGGPATLNFIRDITPQKKIEAQLRQAQKMEAIGTLSGGIAHDFNNILAAIIGYAELVKMKLPEDSEVLPNLDQVLKSGIRAKTLVQQILAFSRKQKLEQKPLQLKYIVKESLKLLRSTLPSDIEIQEDIAKDVGIVNADPTQMHQVIMNLCTNAGHAMRKDGGVLAVGLANVELDDVAAAQYMDIDTGTYLRLSVSDTGHGMTADVKDRIFEPYFTTKEKGVGTGMGLSVVHGIVKNHNGEITVYSEPGKGSTFHVYLPLIQEAAIKLETDGQAPIPTGNERILFIDDEPTLADLGKQMLERLGYKVTTRTSSIEAMELFRAQPDRFDLVITDMTMPNMTGDKLAKEFMKIRPDIPVIICTGFSERISEEKAKGMGIKAFAMKPLVMQDLAKTVRKVLDS